MGPPKFLFNFQIQNLKNSALHVPRGDLPFFSHQSAKDPTMARLVAVLSLFAALKTVLAFSLGQANKATKTPTLLSESFLNRRQWLEASWATTTATTLGLSAPAIAATTQFSTYKDPTGFTLQVPTEWTFSEQTLPDRRQINVWTDPKDASTLLFVAYTPVRDDFTSLGSFGSDDQVANQSILPKGKIAGEAVEATMISAQSAKQAYLFDYKQMVPNVQPETHYRVIFSLQPGATGGAGAVLVTITCQTPEERYTQDLKPILDTIIDSYAISKK